VKTGILVHKTLLKDEILNAHSHLTNEDIKAALAFAMIPLQ